MIRWKLSPYSKPSKCPTLCVRKARIRHAAQAACRGGAVSAVADHGNSESGMRQKPLVVVGSVNADMVLQVERLPEAGETLAAGNLETFPGGKVNSRSYIP